MNKNILIGGLVLIIIAIVMVWYASSGPSTLASDIQARISAITTSSVPAAPTPKVVTPKNTNTFRSIFTQPGSHQCSFDQITTQSRSNYIIYIADGKMRGEFRTASGADTTATIMVYDGSYLYSWKEGTTVGTRSLLTSLSQLPVAIPTDLTSGAVLGTSGSSVSWDCHIWIKNNALLTPPTYVRFSGV